MLPQLLFLCQTLPYPPDGGVWIRTYHVLRLLSSSFDITALCFQRTDVSQSRSRLAHVPDALKRLARVHVFPVPQKQSRIRFGWDHIRSIATQRAYTHFVYQSRPFAELLNRLVGSTAFEIVHADSLVDLAGYLPGICDRIPVIGVHHNVESELLKRRASIEQSQLRRMYLNYQANLVEEVQRRWCGRVALNVAVSTADAAVLNRIAPDARVIVVPNGVDVDEFRPSNGSGGGVAYVGGMNWFPNRDALDFFCGEILPHLKQRRRELEVRWIGAASADEQHVYRDRYGVELTGYVDDVRPLVRDAACHIVPLRVGGGTRLKILNAWAMGKAVVSTSIGCEGLAATDGENILIRDGPKAFADAVATVLADDVLRRRLGNAGRETAERLYSWNRVGERMISAYSMLRRSEPRRSAVGRMECRAAQCVHE